MKLKMELKTKIKRNRTTRNPIEIPHLGGGGLSKSVGICWAKDKGSPRYKDTFPDTQQVFRLLFGELPIVDGLDIVGP